MNVNGNWGFGFSTTASIPQQPNFEGTLDEVLEKLAFNSQLEQLYNNGRVEGTAWWYDGKLVAHDAVATTITALSENLALAF